MAMVQCCNLRNVIIGQLECAGVQIALKVGAFG